MLQQNLDPASSLVGVECNVLAGAVFAEIVGDERLADDIGALARHAGLDSGRVRAAITYARSDDAPSPAGSRTESSSLALASGCCLTAGEAAAETG